MKKIVILPLLVLVALTSGCSIPGLDFVFGGPQVVEYEHDILIIKDIQAIPAEVTPGQQFRIISYIQNLGKETISKEKFGSEISVELYDFCSGLFSIEQVNCPDGKDSIHKNDEQIPFGCNIDKMLPGQVVEVDWVLRTDPSIKLETICPVDGMKVLVRYPYKTTSLTTITIMDAQEMQRQIEEGTFQRKDSYIVAGQGPIKPFLYVEDQQPISEASGSTVLSLQIENKGSGFLAEKIMSKEWITIDLPDSMGAKEDGECSLAEPHPKEDVQLIYGKSPKLLCEVNIPTSEVELEETLFATVDIEYKYEFRDKVNVKVVPKM